MSSHRNEERMKSHTAGTRMRGDVRFASKDEGSSRFDGPRRPRGRYVGHPYEMENERIVHRTRHNNGLIVRVSNNLCHNSSASSIGRRGQGVNHSQASVRPIFKSANNGHPTDSPSQPRIRSETSGRQRSLSFREGLSNIPEPSMLPLDWKPDTSGTLMNYRFQVRTRQRGNVGRRGMSSTARTGDWDRGSGGRRGGGAGGVSNGSGRMRRRGGGVGDDAAASFRVPDNDTAHDQHNQIGEKPRGGIRYRGKTRGFRSARRGGTWRGTTDSHLESKNEVEDYAPDVGKHENSENPEDSNSTDDDQYRLNVDLKVDDVQHADVNPGQANDREEHIDGGLNIVVESHQAAVDSSEEHSEEEEEIDDSEEASEASDGGSASDTDGDTSEASIEEVEAVEALEEDGSSQAGLGSGKPGPLGEESVQKYSEQTKASDDIRGIQQDPSVASSRPRDENPSHEHEAPQISEEKTSPTDPPIEVIGTDPKRRLSHEGFEESKTPDSKTPPVGISPDTNETCLKEEEKAHCLAPTGSINPEDSGRNPQLIQDSGDCETSFESVPADESHNPSNSIMNGDSVLSGKSVTPEKLEISVENAEEVAKEAPLEGGVNKDKGMKAEEPPTEKILEGNRSSS